MKKNIVTGIDLGTSSIRVAVCEYQNGSDSPTVLALVRKNSRGLRRGYIINFEEASSALSEAIKEAERIAGVKIKHATVGMGGVTLESKTADGTAIVARADLEIGPSDIKRAMEDAENNITDMANRTVLHKFPLGFKLDGKKVIGRAEELKGNKLEVRTLFITCSRQHLRDFVRMVEELGIIVDDVVASPLAGAEVMLAKLQKASGAVLANIGSQTTSIAVFEDGNPISLSIFPIGSFDITHDIALGLRIQIEDAERIKKGEIEPTGPRKKLDEIIEARVSDVFEYIENHLKKIGRSGLLPAGVVITGGGSNIANIEELARSYFKLPARVATPAKISGSGNHTMDPAWSVAYGLCLYDCDKNVFPDESASLKKKCIKWLKEFMP